MVVHENNVNTILVTKMIQVQTDLAYICMSKKSYLIDGNVAMDPKDQEAEDLKAVEKVAH